MNVKMGSEKDTDKTAFRITIEPVIFSFVFCISIAESVITTLYLRQSCWTQAGLLLEECHGIDQTRAQKTVSYLEVFKTLIETVLPVFLSFFIGPWSDSNGRKIVLIIPLIGHTITYSIWLVLCMITDLPPGYLLFASLGITFSGGLITIGMAGFCYLADITNNENRAMRMGIAEASVNLGMLAGSILAPYVLHSTTNGYWVVFTLNIAILVINIFYIIFCVPETIIPNPENKKGLFRIDHLKDTYKTVTTKRSTYGRSIMFLLMFVSFLNLLVTFGEGPIKYLSVIKEFGWGIKEYSQYNTLNLLITLVASGVGLWIASSLLKIDGYKLLLATSLLRVCGGSLMGISTSPVMFYIVTLFHAFKSFTGPLVKSSISKLIPQQDVGKVYSFLSSMEAITPQAAIPLYCAIYAQIVATSPLAIYFVTAGVCGLSTAAIIIIMILRSLAARKDKRESKDILVEKLEAHFNCSEL